MYPGAPAPPGVPPAAAALVFLFLAAPAAGQEWQPPIALPSIPADPALPAPGPRTSVGPLTPEPLRNSLGWRAGVATQGLFGSGQGRPLAYVAAGARYKTETVYIDLHFPILVGGLDATQYLFFSEIYETSAPFTFFELINGPYQLAYIEPLHLQLGRTFTLFPFAQDADELPPGQIPDLGAPLWLSIGVVGVADFVVFDLPRFQGEIDDFDFTAPDLTDPIVMGPGAFVALGLGVGSTGELDLALELARDVVDFGGYLPSSSNWVIGLDVDYAVDFSDDFGAFVRGRLSTYTHVTDPLIVTLSFSGGMLVRLF